MRAPIVCLLLTFCFLNKGGAQFYQQLGAGVFIGTGKTHADSVVGSSKPAYAVYGAFYFPRINVLENKSVSVGFSAPITAGISATNNGGSRIGFGFDLPLMVDLSVGAGSSDKAESLVGGFIGAGFGLTHADQKNNYSAPGWTGVERYKGTSFGPVVHTGFRYAHYKWDFTIRLFYKKGLEEQKFQTFGIAGSTSF